MVKKTIIFLAILVVVVTGGVMSAFAEEGGSCQIVNVDEGVSVPAYCDGRINAFDIMQPVAIYYTMADGEAINDDGETYVTQMITGIELWGIDGDGNGYLALWVGMDEIEAAMSVTSGNVLIGSAYGFTLNYAPEVNMFWVTAPGYQFNWEAW